MTYYMLWNIYDNLEYATSLELNVLEIEVTLILK